MMPYILSFTSYTESQTVNMQRAFLTCLGESAGTFPLLLQVARDQSIIIESPVDYDRSLVPEVYRIEDDTYRIPLVSEHRGLELVFVESNQPGRFPSQIQLTIENIEESGLWPLENLHNLISGAEKILDFDFVALYDEDQLAQEVYSARICRLDLSKVPLGIFWVNFFSNKITRNIGERAKQAIESSAFFSRRLQSGLLFATQGNPFQFGQAEDESRIEALESILDYESLERKYPNQQ